MRRRVHAFSSFSLLCCSRDIPQNRQGDHGMDRLPVKSVPIQSPTVCRSNLSTRWLKNGEVECFRVRSTDRTTFRRQGPGMIIRPNLPGSATLTVQSTIPGPPAATVSREEL